MDAEITNCSRCRQPVTGQEFRGPCDGCRTELRERAEIRKAMQQRIAADKAALRALELYDTGLSMDEALALAEAEVNG